MKMIKYKDSYFNLIIEKDHLLLSKSDMTQYTMNETCNICQKIIKTNSTMKEHIEKYHNEKLQKCDCKPKDNVIESLTKKVKLLESQLKVSEEKRKGPL